MTTAAAATATGARLAAEYRMQTLRTVRLIRVFADKDLDLRPAGGSWTLREQISHLIVTHAWLEDLVRVRKPTLDRMDQPIPVDSIADAVRKTGERMKAAAGAMEEVSDEAWWEDVLEVLGSDFAAPRGVMTSWMFEHETHHRGQLCVYARIAGLVPPVYYYPVDETVLEI